MNEMSATAREVAQSAVVAPDTAKKADLEAQNGCQVVKKTVDVIGGLVDDVEPAGGVIGKLATDSENIGAVLDVTGGIAQQTARSSEDLAQLAANLKTLVDRFKT